MLGVSSEMGEFFKRISTIESDYSKALGKLCKGFAQKKLIANPHLDGYVCQRLKAGVTEALLILQ